jgi:hypothetical protein
VPFRPNSGNISSSGAWSDFRRLNRRTTRIALLPEIGPGPFDAMIDAARGVKLPSEGGQVHFPGANLFLPDDGPSPGK